jgi:hypothetical protein
MKRLSIVLCVALPLLAQETKTQKVEEFMRLAKLDETLKQQVGAVVAQVRGTMQQQLDAARLSTQLRKPAEDLIAEAMKLLDDNVGWDKLQPDVVKVYSDNLTDQDLDGILEFYRSAPGQAFVAKTPVMMGQAAQIAQTRLNKIAPQLDKIMDEFARKLPPVPTKR